MLSTPITSQHVTNVAHSWLPTTIVSMQGHRLENEDCHAKFTHRSETGARIIHAIFDGHGGGACALFYSTKLPEYFSKIQNPMKRNEILPMWRQMDRDFRKWAFENKDESGSTAIVSIIERRSKTSGRILTFYVGDSGALLIRRSQNDLEDKFAMIRLSHDHKPELVEERKRIEAAGHIVSNVAGVWRVDGELAMSRSVGDYRFKNNRQPQAVTCEPDFIESDFFIQDILALYCDGLVENQSHSNLANSILDNLGSLSKCARACVLDSIRGGSTDNHSIMLSIFDPSSPDQQSSRDTAWFPGPFFPRSDEEKFIRRYFSDASKNGKTPLDNFISACAMNVEETVQNVDLPKDRKSTGNELVDRVLYILSIL